ncbi:MAG: hypothetical protein Q8P24_12235 [Desulfobacterales bacterium]|nr:hypothetical protein [Desulfobacterales bacterium]
METVKLKGAFSPNPRLDPLLDGTIKIPGVDIRWESGSPRDLHLMHIEENSCDIFEFSLSNYMITRDKPAERERLRWTALPMFLSKAFMWLAFYVNKNSGIKSLADLRGKRLGVPDYHMTAAVWMRIVFKELYGILPQDIEWFNGRPPGLSHGRNIRDTVKPGIRISQAKKSSELKDKLDRGELDAAYGAGDELFETATVRALFKDDEASRMIGQFRQKAGTTPTNHVLIVQQDLCDRHPGLAKKLYTALEASKQEAYKRARRYAPGYLLFAEDVFAGQEALFGDDPFPSGIAGNMNMLKSLANELLEEGLIGKLPDIKGLFHETVRGT